MFEELKNKLPKFIPCRITLKDQATGEIYTRDCNYQIDFWDDFYKNAGIENVRKLEEAPS